MIASLGLYGRLVSIQLRARMQYRTSFFMDLMASAAITFVEFLAIALVFQRFEQLGGWSLAQVAFLYGLVSISFKTMDLLCRGFDPQTFGEDVRKGTFDRHLLRPAGVSLQVLGSYLDLHRVGAISQGLLIFAFALLNTDIDWSPAKLAYLPVVLLSQVAFFAGLFLIGSTITFWTVDSIEAINIFTYGGQEMMSYPMSIYPLWMQRFFTFVVPAIFLNYYPALWILGIPDPTGAPAFFAFLAPVAGALVMGAAVWFWRRGLRHYRSTGT